MAIQLCEIFVFLWFNVKEHLQKRIGEGGQLSMLVSKQFYKYLILFYWFITYIGAKYSSVSLLIFPSFILIKAILLFYSSVKSFRMNSHFLFERLT